jgi:hypothetical protein
MRELGRRVRELGKPMRGLKKIDARTVGNPKRAYIFLFKDNFFSSLGF